MSERQEHHFKAEVTQVLRLVIQSLYSNQEVFLRELVSNASDALDKLRFRAIQTPELISADHTLKIRLMVDAEKKTLTIWDNGIGMSKEELAQSLGTVAWSGTREFAEKLKQAQSADQKVDLIGQFGVGFYSAYLVADEVEVLSRAAGTEEANVWRSKGESTFTIEPSMREVSGTSVVLHLKDEAKEFLDSYRIKSLISRYSDYIAHPIELGEKAKDSDELEFKAINQASALWQRNPKEVTEEQYHEFYKHLTHDWEPPIAYKHFKIEGTQMFVGLLFLPKRAPFDLFEAEPTHGVRLHVKRVFVMDNCQELVPRWLRFIRGVVDSEDLPLNVSREVLQDSRAVRIIKKQVVSQSLDLLEELATQKPEGYLEFWKAFGAVIKEGLHFDPEYKDRVSKLLRYESSAGAELTSLDAYVERMKVGQNAIYYATGTSRTLLESSPHLELLKKRGYEVLYLTDPVDPFAITTLETYREKPLVSAMQADLKLDDSEKPKSDEKPEDKPDLAPLIVRLREVLKDKVSEVRASERLTDSPVCLVVSEGGMSPQIERMMRASRMNVPESRRIFEVNVDHPLIQRLSAIEAAAPGGERVADWIYVLYDQALLSEGSPIADPGLFAKRLSALLTLAAAQESAA
ncbi:MAG: molecular chaperone HtpG [Polyangiaceae bacterium]|nr:molecular chaperone HtpG [Polyangiaceae bacterium]